MMHKYCGLGISFGFLEEYTGENMPSGKDWRMVAALEKVDAATKKVDTDR